MQHIYKEVKVVLVLAVCVLQGVASIGPGLPKNTYTQAEALQKELSRVIAPPGHGHGRACMVDGYFFCPFFNDQKPGGGGFDVLDLSDPTHPKQMLRVFDANTKFMREPHAFGFSEINGKRILVMQGVNGIVVWDMTDILKPIFVCNFPLPGITVGVDYAGIWWCSFQAPYVYVSGNTNGLFIVDLSDPANPVLVKNIPNSQLGITSIGANQVIGNLLILASNAASNISASPLGGRFTSMDISNPANPVLIKNYGADGTFPNGYGQLINGERLLIGGVGKHMHMLDISDAANFKVFTPLNLEAPGGYINIQDGVAVSGFQYKVVAVKFTGDQLVFENSGTTDNKDKDDNFGIMLGNIIFASNDHTSYSSFMVYKALPDNNPPEVNMVRPKDGDVSQALTSRIGMTFTDELEISSVNPATVIVRPVGGAALAGHLSYQTNIVNFWPSSPLLPNTTYEVIVPVGGVKDVSGNAITKPFRSTFSTGASVAAGASVALAKPADGVVGKPVNFTLDSFSGTGTLEYTWNFGDGTPTTAASTTPTASHVYTAAKSYIVKVTVKDAANNTATSSATIVIATQTGIKGFSSNGHFQYKLNFEAHTLTLQGLKKADYRLTLRDAMGKALSSGRFTGTEYVLAISTLRPGTYILELATAEKTTETSFKVLK